MSKPKAFLDQESSFKGQYSKEVFEALMFAYRPIVKRILFFIVVGFVGRIALLSNANLIGAWVDSFCQGEGCKPLPGPLEGFANEDFIQVLVLLTLIGFLFTATFRIVFSRLSAQAVSHFYDEVTLRTSRLPIRFFDQNPVGRIVTRFSSDYGNVFRLFGGPLAEFLMILFDLSSMIILTSIASPYYLPIFILIGFMNYVVYRLNVNRLRLERRALSAIRSPSIAHFAETTQGASSIRAFARQSIFFRRFRELNDRFLQQRLRTSSFVLGFSLQMSFMTAFLLLLTGLAGAWLTSNGFVSVGSIGVAFTFIVLSGASLQSFFEWMAQFEEAMTGVERLNDYLRRDLEVGAKLPSARKFATHHPAYSEAEEGAVKAQRLVQQSSAEVVVDDLWLRYGADAPFVLKGLNFSIRSGEKVGIVGRTGSGKTSFVQALFHLYGFEKGRILINGKSPREDVDLSVFRKSIALISQEPTLFRGTIRENLDLARQHTDEELLDALERVGLRDWLETQPKRLMSEIEERGRNLSAGEKQLLCMARCLLQDAPVVVMDEATSAVDPQSEEILVRATREFFSDRTQIIIAHRLSTLDHCDRVLWLQDGAVKMFDAPQKVLPEFKSAEL